MEFADLLAYAALGGGAGLLIGCVGIGGVILVPALVYLAGHSVPTAIAAAMCAFVVSGIVGTHAYSKEGSIRWRVTIWMWLGALPCAFGGALLVSSVSPALLELAIALLAAGSGLHVLAARRERPNGNRALSAPMLAAVGGATGFLSALTGTGGPLVLVPVLVALDVPILASIGLAQAIQLPVAAAATGGYLLSGLLDVRLALALAAGIALGTWSGAKAAHALPTGVLRRAVAVLLVLVGGAMLLSLAATRLE
jgi:uncharacterized membrane protein YfcA